MNVSKINYEIRFILGDIMKEKGYTQNALSELSGVLQGSISRIIKGNERYSIEHLFRIADALNIKIEDLFEVNRRPQ